MKTPGGLERELKKVLEEAGLQAEFGRGGKHPFVDFVVNGIEHRVFFAGSPRTQYSLMRAKAEIRRRIEGAPLRAGSRADAAMEKSRAERKALSAPATGEGE